MLLPFLAGLLHVLGAVKIINCLFIKASKIIRSTWGKILPFELTTNSVKFNIHIAVKWLMEKHGLWDYVLDGDIVTMAATVDGGALAWKLSDVSAGIKFAMSA